jgi:FMN-dependent NADH-azoreductase
MKRYFALTSDCTVTSLGLFDQNAPDLDAQLVAAANAKAPQQGGFFLTDDEVYRLVETSRNALNTP